MPETITSPQPLGDDSFSAMFEATLAEPNSTENGAEGQIVSGLVVQLTHDAVVVDIGGKSEGVISKSQFLDAHGELRVAVGDNVDVFVESRENDDGLISLSKEKA